MFSKLFEKIKGVIRKVIPYKDITQIEKVETPLSTDMQNALELWYRMYINKAPWLEPGTVYSLNLPAFICSEVARQIMLEFKWDITGTQKNSEGESVSNPRADFLKAEFERLSIQIRNKLETALASGGFVIKPYVRNQHIYFDYTMDWSMYPVAFGDDGELTDVIFADTFSREKEYFTRLERHTLQSDGSVIVTQKAYKSKTEHSIGTQIPLTDVEMWQDLQPETQIANANGMLCGWFRVAHANTIDPESPLGCSVYARAAATIEQADKQYSNFLWEYEASQMAIDVDPMALKPSPGGKGREMPKLNERLFRSVDLGEDNTYNVFAPQIRDASQIAGMNQLFLRIEDQVGLARGTISDANVEAKTATELKINKQRSYATVADNQAALERCLKDVIKAMDTYATLYHLAPPGQYDVSFEWDDSIITDMESQVQERLMLVNAKIISKSEFRQWYLGETKAQADAAVSMVTAEDSVDLSNIMPELPE